MFSNKKSLDKCSNYFSTVIAVAASMCLYIFTSAHITLGIVKLQIAVFEFLC